MHYNSNSYWYTTCIPFVLVCVSSAILAWIQLSWTRLTYKCMVTCIDSSVVELKVCHFPCCSRCPTGGLIGEADTARSSQGHLVSSNWPVWTDQPTVHHSVWEDHCHSHHTPQHTFLLTSQHHRKWYKVIQSDTKWYKVLVPWSGTGVLCKGSCPYTKWKW